MATLTLTELEVPLRSRTWYGVLTLPRWVLRLDRDVVGEICDAAQASHPHLNVRSSGRQVFVNFDDGSEGQS